jgi:hypothetical protein
MAIFYYLPGAHPGDPPSPPCTDGMAASGLTPAGSFVVSWGQLNPDWSYAESENINTQVFLTYPLAWLLEGATAMYNCHGYSVVLEPGRGGRVWLNSQWFNRYITDGSYVF